MFPLPPVENPLLLSSQLMELVDGAAGGGGGSAAGAGGGGGAATDAGTVPTRLASEQFCSLETSW